MSDYQTCDEVTLIFFTKETEEFLTFRIGEYIILTLYVLFLAYVLCQLPNYYKHRDTISKFTMSILSLITLAIIMGMTESVLTSMGANPSRNPTAYDFTFGHCWLGVLTLSEIHSLITYLAALTIAGEYHYVAKQADSMIGQGVLLPNRELRHHWTPYLVIAALAVTISASLYSLDAVYKL